MDEPNLRESLEELQQRYSALAHEYEQLKHLLNGPQTEIKLAIFDRLPMPIWACDRDCRIVFWNAGAARLYGYSAEEAIGKDFVNLFVNKPEREKARIDCVDIIDNSRPIKNMADDIDKHGNTRKLVTQCFPIYNVEGHSGLQVEISYEVQDIERLQAELAEMQEAYKRTEAQREELEHRLVDVTRTRALTALDSLVSSVKDMLRQRRIAVDKAALTKDADARMIEKARAAIKEERDRLITWEREARKQVMSHTEVEALETLIVSIERNEMFDV
jgi:PAS domain S-box-containing protein